MQYQSHDEIGRLATAFDDMLDELAVAREREITQHLELARAARLTTMGEMAASIAHELNQPLAAIVANGHAGLRWLGRATPDLDEVKASLQRIVSVGDRASQIVGTIRATFKKGSEEKVTTVDVNDTRCERCSPFYSGSCTVIGSSFGPSLRRGFRERQAIGFNCSRLS